LVGKKGTGKTAYATFLANNHYKDTTASVKYLGESEYVRFHELIKSKHIQFSSYKDIWSVILLLLILRQLKDSEIKTGIIEKVTKFKSVNDAIDEFYAYAFSPEISQAITMVEESTDAAGITLKHLNLNSSDKQSIQFSESRIQMNLLYLSRQFKECLSAIRIKNDHILFLDGIDIRPPSIPYTEYIACIKGLADAAWDLDNQFLPELKSGKRIRIVLLLRPDIFQSLGLHNATNKLKDNAVYLDWRTTYPEYKNSDIFAIAETILSAQQAEQVEGNCWDKYFPFTLQSTSPNRPHDDSFISMLRNSYSRPRDIVTQLEIFQRFAREPDSVEFLSEDIANRRVQNEVSEYLMGTIRDQLLFYFSDEEYEAFRLFFHYLNELLEFPYTYFQDAFSAFIADHRVKDKLPAFSSSPEEFLQFLYDLNILCYYDKSSSNDTQFHWCYRERDASNLSPKVRLNHSYRIHYGLARNLGLSRSYDEFSRSKPSSSK
jgi:hypothetical protein